MSRRMFSIVVPCYRVRAYLQECLASVLAQSEFRWECVCVDDGSGDGLDEIVDSAVRADVRFRAVHQPNRGVSAARNRALARIRGEWVLFLDGDDLFHPHLLREVARTIEIAPRDLDAVLFRATVGDEHGVCFPPCPVPLGQRFVTLGADGTPADHRAMYGALWEVAYRRGLLDGLRFDVTLKYGEDLLFLIRAIVRMRVAAIQAWKPYGLRLRQGSAMRSAVTEKRVADGIAFGEAAFVAIMGTPLARDASFVRMLYGGVTERVASEIMGQVCREALWRRWLVALDAIANIDATFSPWQRMALRVLTRFRRPWVAWILCVMPYWVKRRINRQKLRVWWARAHS